MSNFALPKYTVYFDTNAVFSTKPGEPISSGFLKALAQIREMTGVDVRMPVVVFEEICYQKIQAAIQAAANQVKNAETIQQVSGIGAPRIPDEKSLRGGCAKILQRCLEEHGISLVDVPIQKIDWSRVIGLACWRQPPFEKPKSEDDLAEKGFRDCMIIETVVHDAETVGDGHIAVLSKDKVFAAGLESRTGRIKRPIEPYDGCGALLSQLRLTREMKSEQFASAVLERVGTIFYNPDDPKCVVIAHNLIEKLREEYDEAMSQPSILSLLKSGEATTAPGDWLSEIAEWSPVSDLKISATTPEFAEIDEQRRYHWKSEITLARLLRRNHPVSKHWAGMPDEKIRIQKVNVLWSAEVNPDAAEFSNTRIDELEPLFGDDFIDATWQMRSSLDLPLIPGGLD